MVAGVCARSTCRRQRMRPGLAASHRNGPSSGKKAAVTQVLVRFADDRSGCEDKHQRCAVLCRELCAKVKEDDEETDLLLHHLSKFDKQLSARRRKRRAHQMAVASQPMDAEQQLSSGHPAVLAAQAHPQLNVHQPPMTPMTPGPLVDALADKSKVPDMVMYHVPAPHPQTPATPTPTPMP